MEQRVALSSRDAGTGEACPGRHCWVADPADGTGTLRPGLLLEWRQATGDGWEGRVVYPVRLRAGRWATVEEWVPAVLLTEA